MANLQSSSPIPSRLADPRPAVRRIAAMDLLRDAHAEGLHALVARIATERDERCFSTIAKGLAALAFLPARDVLAKICEDTSVPAAIAHAALLSHDAIELAHRPAPAAPVIDPDAGEEGDA